jgi:hypothetical protein
MLDRFLVYVTFWCIRQRYSYSQGRCIVYGLGDASGWVTDALRLDHRNHTSRSRSRSWSRS